MTQTTTTVNDAVAAGVRKYRQLRAWSIRRLAEECERLGAPELTAASLTNIERGQLAGARRRRDITVNELLTLSYALAVPPLLLLVGLGENEALAVTPTIKIPTGRALRWAAGEEPPTDSNGRALQLETWRRNTRPLILNRRVDAAEAELRAARAQLRSAEEVGNVDRIEAARERWVSALGELADVLNAMAETGIPTPGIAAEVINDMRRLGLLRYPDAVRVMTERATEPGRPNQ